MKILSVVGTRPNFIKEALINQEMKKRGIREVLVHTGQHYDYEMSRVFFKELDIPEPDYHLHVSTGLAGKQTAEMIEALEAILVEEKPDVTLVYGDVTSTLAGALASVRLSIPVVHVEAGIRTAARYNPEEINRRATDCLSELLLANTQDACDSLIKENHTGSEIVLTGDVMNDVLMDTIKRFDIPIRHGDYNICTLHRVESVDDKSNLRRIVDALIQSEYKTIFPVHPRTRKRLLDFNLLAPLESSGNIELCEPQGYLEFVNLLAGANKVITDSGGVRREAYILGKPGIIVIDISWFPCISDVGWKVITGPDTGKIINAIECFEPPKDHPELFGDGKAYIKIVDAIENSYSEGSKRAPKGENSEGRQ